ncbi:MAG: trypsin-like peptidase domain-containing protein [Anaerolineales bacterium]
MNSHRRWGWVPFITALAIILAACGAPEPTDAPQVAEEQESTTRESGKKAEIDDEQSSSNSGGAASLQEVQNATVLIEAQGTFIDPELGMQVNAAGSGSGFIIDPSGLAVTNNHVVTGAALLRVWVAGEDSPRNAKILGVSECSDLAVIDIEGDDFEYLDWYTGDVDVGLEVYSAGFPLGDPEFTLTKGIISKAHADGETSWASIDSVLEHDATINPGNSGGPLVEANGRVVGVNYATSLIADNQYFAINAQEARSIIARLKTGDDVDSLGINGVAVSTGDGSLSGIWVASVASGSPADETGIQAGDILTALEGLVLSTDGTMADYCDVIRTQGTDATMSVEVLRYATDEVLEGQINGRSLNVAGSFAGTGSGGGSTGEGYSAYNYVFDDYSALQVEVPSDWSDVDGSPWVQDDLIFGSSLWASSDLQGFVDSWEVPGLIFDVSANVEALGGLENYLNDVSDSELFQACVYEGREDYSDGLYAGQADYFSDCGGVGTDYFLLLAAPLEAPDAFLIELHIQMPAGRDWDAAERIVDSFEVIGTLPNEYGSTSNTTNSASSSGYVWVYDDYESMRMQVPTTWDQIDGTPWYIDNQVVGGGITAAADLQGYYDNWGYPGVMLAASDDLASQLGYVELLNEYQAYGEGCEYVGRYDYEDALYRGKYDLFEKCGGPGGSTFFQLVAVSQQDQFAYLIHLQMVITEESHWDALDQVLATFEVVGQLP